MDELIMDSLNRQVAEAQGWTKTDARSFDGCGDPRMKLWLKPDGKAVPCILYTPGHDLSEAVAFAEWAIREKLGGNTSSGGHYLEFDYSTWGDRPLSWNVRIIPYADEYHCAKWQSDIESLAEGLCRVVLGALGYSEGRVEDGES